MDYDDNNTQHNFGFCIFNEGNLAQKVTFLSVLRPCVNFVQASDWAKVGMSYMLCYIVQEVIKVDEFEEANMYAAAEK